MRLTWMWWLKRWHCCASKRNNISPCSLFRRFCFYQRGARFKNCGICNPSDELTLRAIAGLPFETTGVLPMRFDPSTDKRPP